MKETPILMTPANYGKCEVGSKTKTRRIITLPKDRGHWESSTIGGGGGVTDSKGRPTPEQACIWNTTTGKTLICHFGTVGDRLYVKEAHYLWGRWDLVGHTKTGKSKYRFRRTTTEIRYREDPPTKDYDGTRATMRSQWHRRSALFLEKKDARLWLELTDVRVERIQDISLVDVGAEGYAINVDGGSPRDWAKPWNTINGEGAWERNDWVWVLSFKRVK